jgi:nucleotide-binding universal stress UspA family protein
LRALPIDEEGATMARSSLFRHILVPHDFSNPATLALKTAARLAKEHGGRLTVLHVLVPFYLPADVPFGMPAEGDLVPEQRKQLNRLVTKALGRGGPRITRPCGNPSGSAVKLAGSESAVLVRTGIDRLETK